MGTPINPGDLAFTTRQYYLNGGLDTAKGTTLTFEDLDSTLIFLSSSIANNGQTYTAGDGIDIINNTISSKLLTVNLQSPTNGNIPLSITATITGPSSSLSGSPYFLPNTYSPRPPVSGTIFVVSGDIDANKNGNAYIFVTSSTQAGSWQQIFGFNETTADARYVKLSSDTLQEITSPLLISGSTTFSGSLIWSGASDLGGASNYVLVLDENGQIYKTGSYTTVGNIVSDITVNSANASYGPYTGQVIINTSTSSSISTDYKIKVDDNFRGDGFSLGIEVPYHEVVGSITFTQNQTLSTLPTLGISINTVLAGPGEPAIWTLSSASVSGNTCIYNLNLSNDVSGSYRSGIFLTNMQASGLSLFSTIPAYDLLQASGFDGDSLSFYLTGLTSSLSGVRRQKVDLTNNDGASFSFHLILPIAP